MPFLSVQSLSTGSCDETTSYTPTEFQVFSNATHVAFTELRFSAYIRPTCHKEVGLWVF